MGEDLAVYFERLLPDADGLNIRNEVAHGLLESSSFTTALTNGVLHWLLLLSGIREAKQESLGGEVAEHGEPA
jgi:hypothetical protein